MGIESEINKIIDDFEQLSNVDIEYYEWNTVYKIALKKCMKFYDKSYTNSKIIIYAQKLLWDKVEREMDKF